MNILNLIAVLCFVCANFGESARILAIFQVPSLSHQNVFQPLWKELSLRGHNVTVITPYPLKDAKLTNLTEIDVSYLQPLIGKEGFQFFMSKTEPVYKKVHKLFEVNALLAEAILKDERVVRIYNNTEEKYDLLLLQTFFSPIFYSLSAKLGAPAIGVSSLGAFIGSHYAIGNPNHPALYSEFLLPYNGDLSFWERIKSTLYYLFIRFYLNFVAIPKGDEIVRKYLGNYIPYLGESERNLSMLFLNTNPVLYTPRPTVPTIITLGQMHLKPPQPIDPDLKSVLDKATNGVVYFSLGSNVKSVNMPEKLRKTVIETFADLPYTILWKWEAEDLPGKPENVIIRKWLKQQDVLAHSNIKVFITQCGLQSIEESISRGVPIVGMPFIADQEMNIKQLEKFGVGKSVDYIDLEKNVFRKTIIEVAENKTYREKVKELHALWNDQPMTGLERAIWWTEYVIRHKGTKHLKSPTADIPWIQYFLIDVIAALILTIFITSYMIYKSLSILFKFIFVSSTANRKTIAFKDKKKNKKLQ